MGEDLKKAREVAGLGAYGRDRIRGPTRRVLQMTAPLAGGLCSKLRSAVKKVEG